MEIFIGFIKVIIIALQVIIALYLSVPFLSLLSYGIVSLLRINPPYTKKPLIFNKDFNFALIITAHQETQFIVPLVDSILKQSYNNYHIYIVADDCDMTSFPFKDPRITILEPEDPLNSKIRSIHYAIDHFNNTHDALIILDADNLIHPRFLSVMLDHFRKGYKVVQCDFKPKNTDSDYARMDAIGDMVNFFIDREVRMRLNISAAIWGSGVAIDVNLYKEVSYSDFLGGFDKKLQSHLVQRVHRIGYAPEAILYDEKISSGKSLEIQRSRWIHSYFKYFKESAYVFVNGLKKFDLNLIYFGFSILRPPLFLIIGFAFIFTFLNYFIIPLFFYSWMVILLLFLLSFVTIVALKSKDSRYIKTMIIIPLFAFRQMRGLLKMKNAKRSFLRTPHSKLVFIDDLLKMNAP